MPDTTSTSEIHKVIIIGSGPAGLTAALYTSRAQLEPLLFEGIPARWSADDYHRCRKLSGFPEGILGPELMKNMREQATRFAPWLEARP